MEKPKNLYVRPMDMNYGGVMQVGGGCRMEGNKWGKMDNCNSITNKIYFNKRKIPKIRFKKTFGANQQVQ